MKQLTQEAEEENKFINDEEVNDLEIHNTSKEVENETPQINGIEKQDTIKRKNDNTFTKLKNKELWIRKYLDLDLLKNVSFMSFNFLMMCAFLMISAMAVFLAGLALERNITYLQLGIAFIVLSACDIVGRFVSGFLFDIQTFKKRRMLIFIALGFFMGLGVALMPLSYDLLTFILISMLRTVPGAAFHAQHFTILGDIVGRRKYASGLGLSRFFQGIGLIAGPTLGGKFSLRFPTFICEHCSQEALKILNFFNVIRE